MPKCNDCKREFDLLRNGRCFDCWCNFKSLPKGFVRELGRKTFERLANSEKLQLKNNA